MLIFTIWLFNIAMENPLTGGFKWKIICKWAMVSMAMLNNQRVVQKNISLNISLNNLLLRWMVAKSCSTKRMVEKLQTIGCLPAINWCRVPAGRCYQPEQRHQRL